MKIFLKAKHWHIFLVTLGLPILIEIIAMTFIIMGNNPMLLMSIMPLMMLFFMGGLLGWLWAVANELQAKVPAGVTGVKMKVKKFKTFFFVPLAYFILITGLIIFGFQGFINDSKEPGVELIGTLIGIIIPLHLFSMFCIFYSLYFAAKTFKTVELQREVSFSDFAGEFFMIWLFPIGIWIIQPKINKMIES